MRRISSSVTASVFAALMVMLWSIPALAKSVPVKPPLIRLLVILGPGTGSGPLARTGGIGSTTGGVGNLLRDGF